MGHADLRIRERTLPAVADRAYELLRDRTRLAAFVQKMLTAHHAEAADRAALDLEDRDAPARLVVTREGHAVTCLGSGMAANLPVIPWPRTHAYLAGQKEVLRRRIAEVRADEEDGVEALARVYSHPHRLTRAEFDKRGGACAVRVEKAHGLQVRQSIDKRRVQPPELLPPELLRTTRASSQSSTL